MCVRVTAVMGLGLALVAGCSTPSSGGAGGGDAPTGTAGDTTGTGGDVGDPTGGDTTGRDTTGGDTADGGTTGEPGPDGCIEGVCGPDNDGNPCEACASLPVAFGTSCDITGSPEPPTSMKTVPAFPNLTFTKPVHLTNAGDGTDRIFVVEQPGRIKVFPNDPDVVASQVKFFLDITGRVNDGPNEAGLLSVAFHPDYANNGRLFVNYTASQSGLVTRVSEFSASGDSADPNSEIVRHTVAQPYGNHNGGQIAFGPDGYLYIGHGDGGSAGDPLNSGQTLSSVLGKMLRIDIDTDAETSYLIPPGNPFVGSDPVDVRPEIFAWGLRNPWRFSFDRLTGQLWAADVGQDAWEYVHIVEIGRNYGWNIIEGSHCFNPAFNCNKEGLELPVLEYDHTEGKSITGGFVYRGAKHPALYGAYLYGDYVTRTIWAARFGAEEEIEITKLEDSNISLTSFGEDEAGELYLLDSPYFSPTQGTIFRLEDNDATPPTTVFPKTLSATGCFADVPSLAPAEGVLEYEVNASLWHDGARSVRHVVLPEGASIEAPATGPWTLPQGTKLIKTFVLDQPDGTTTRLETRFVLVEGPRVKTYSYRWDEAQDEAYLLSGDAEWEVEYGGKPYTWHYPSRSQCLTCHNEGSGQVLGWRTGQLNRSMSFGPVTGNQLYVLEQLGVLTAPANPAEWPDPYGDGDVTLRARASLDANCGSCHVPNGPVTTDLDLRYDTPLSQMDACNVDPEKGDVGVPGAKILAPGSAEQSTLWLRLDAPPPDRMPNLGSVIKDEPAADLLKQWIDGLTGCD